MAKYTQKKHPEEKKKNPHRIKGGDWNTKQKERKKKSERVDFHSVDYSAPDSEPPR